MPIASLRRRLSSGTVMSAPMMSDGALITVPLLNRIRNEVIGMGLDPERLYSALMRFRQFGDRGRHTRSVPAYQLVKRYSGWMANPDSPYHLLANPAVWVSGFYPKRLLKPIPSWFKELTHEPAA